MGAGTHMSMSMIEVEEIACDLEAFLRRSFQIPVDDPGFTRQVNLWEEGYVDSVGVVETVAHIESRWQIVLPEHVVFDPAFTNVAGMAELIARVLHRGSA
jgi:acyl carrier protein